MNQLIGLDDETSVFVTDNTDGAIKAAKKFLENKNKEQEYKSYRVKWVSNRGEMFKGKLIKAGDKIYLRGSAYELKKDAVQVKGRDVFYWAAECEEVNE